MQASFDNTVQILVKAYLADELEKHSCAACACGNIIAASQGWQVVNVGTLSGAGFAARAGGRTLENIWQRAVWAFRDGDNEYDAETLAESEAQIAQAGYTVEQFQMIEDAFMDATGYSKEEEHFNGLMAVVDVLADIHGIDLATAEVAKGLFVRA